MSHDLFSMQRRTWDRWQSRDENPDSTPWSLAESERAERLASALLDLNPRLKRFAFDYAEIADFEGIGEDEARNRYRYIELDHAHGDNAITIQIDRDHAWLTIPYWYSGLSARATFLEAFAYLRLIERQEGWVSVDPYHGVIDLDHDLEAVVGVYEGYSAIADRIRHREQGTTDQLQD